ncbi:cofactor FMO1 FAD enzyme [Penicillium robsamsonii]|uniref:cofactor FMO1 FAD enzyme n=1 Tax=Penicillium robsamsonii TaxID=1792511 RepID=UPI002547EE3F|nr:cofactor FMO1 FAD enzyme [Penicillium robsamsonii]KAJ5817286.1 cofactor FMO1 FAD enzyme [Penicillium robsamsonii]
MGSIATAEKVDVVVVGAGWNGLIAAKTYLDLSASANLIIIDEQATIGGVWSAEKIYPSLYAQINHGLFEYSFYPMKREGITEDGYISGQTIHQYLCDFAQDFDLVRRTRLQTTVTNVSQLDDKTWHLEISGKPPVECKKLIYASGATSHPVVPKWPTDETFSSPVIHSADVGSHLNALDKIQTATVLGGAKSAYDTVFLLLKAGKKVNWIIREDGSGPLAIMPPTIFGLINTMDVTTMGITRLMGASIMSTDGYGHQFFQRTALGRFLAWIFWIAINWVADVHAGYSKSENATKLRPKPSGNGIFWAQAGVGAASVPSFWKTFHAGDVTVHRTNFASFRGTSMVHLKNGTSFETDYIILCTGFDKSYHVFSEQTQQRCGLVPTTDRRVESHWTKLEAEAVEKVDELLPQLCNPPATLWESHALAKEAGGRRLLHGPSRHYRRLIVPKLAASGDRSICFPGFIHSIYTPFVAETQALWSVAFLLGLLDLPSQEDMETEVAEWNVWTRKRYISQGKKNAYAIYDFLPYIGLLLGDLGINANRKKGWFAGLFEATYPREYNGLIEEFRQALAAKSALKMNTTAAGIPKKARFD